MYTSPLPLSRLPGPGDLYAPPADDTLLEQIDTRVAALLADDVAVANAWTDDCEAMGEGLSGVDVAIALIGHPDDRAARALRLLDVIEAKVTGRLQDQAKSALQQETDEADEARADAALWVREDAA